MKVAILSALLGVISAIDCVYESGRYTLNLTNQSSWTLEYESENRFYYYTPCRNGLRCEQGNAAYYSNIDVYIPGENQCLHYLAVDHHESPDYLFYGGAWRFQYGDGEICDETQEPRRTTVYFHCNEEYKSPITIYDVNEPSTCNYVVDLRGYDACVPESSHNANCQWRTPTGTGGYYYLDLSELNETTIYSRLPNGYYHTITPCRNGLYCYQQYGNRKVMGVIDNHETGTCEHYGAIWEDGRVQPALHGVDTDQQHWSFHYYNGQSCSNGDVGEEELRFFCDESVETAQVINTTSEDCRFFINIATQYACINRSELLLPKGFNRIEQDAKPKIGAHARQIYSKIKNGVSKMMKNIKKRD